MNCKKIIFIILNFFCLTLNLFTFDNLPLNFAVNKTSYEKIIKKIKEKNLIHTENKRKFYPLSRVVSVKPDNSSKIKLIKFVFDTGNILKTKVYFIDYRFLNDFIDYYKNNYRLIKKIKNPVERVKFFLLFDLDTDKAAMIELRKGKDYFSLRITDKKFYAEVLSHLRKEIIKTYNKIFKNKKK